MFDFLIVGTGLFGATCAFELKKKGFSCLAVDKRNHIAGNIYTKEIEGINVHEYGAHIFHTSDARIWDYVNRFASFNGFINQPLARFKNELFNLPFNMNTFSKLWKDVFTPEDAKKRIEEEKASYPISEPKNLEEQAISLVGRTIYEKLIKGYTAKQWGRNCDELPAFIIKRLPVRFTFDNNYFNDRYQGIPVGGYTQIIEKMLEGIEVRLNCNFLKEKRELYKIARKIIYTGPIDEYFDYCFGELEYRKVVFETEVLNISNYQGNAVVNYTDYDIPFTRVIEHKHFEFDLASQKTVVTREYPSSWKKGEEAFYPINDERNNYVYELYKEKASTKENLFFGGRLGQYKYFDMDKTIKSALELVDKLS